MSRKEKKEALKKVKISALQQMGRFKLLSALFITTWYNSCLTGLAVFFYGIVFCF